MLIQLQQYLENTTKRYPEKTALIYNKKSWTYRELNELSNRFAAALIKKGLKRGDRVAIQFGNSPETVIAFWAVLKSGGATVVMHPELKLEKTAYILRDSEAIFWMVSQMTLNTLQISSQTPTVKSVIYLTSEIEDLRIQTFYHFYHVINESNLNLSLFHKNIDLDLAAIIYTSGSTGEPKGVMHSHRSMLTASQAINQYLGNYHDDIILSVLPLSFDYGLYQIILATAVGATVILERDLLLPQRFLKLIETQKVTIIPVVPTLIAILHDHISRLNLDLSSVRYVSNTGGALSQKHFEKIKTLFPQAKIFSMYGLTECKRCTYLPPEDLDRKKGSVGIAIPNTEMWIIDQRGNRLSPHQTGQLVIRGSTIMMGYWNKPQETAEKLKPGFFPGENILYTGDYGWLDEEGYFYFEGRIDEVIKSRGQNISPKEIEDVLLSYSGISEVAVVGIPDESLGHGIYAFLSLENQESLSSEKLTQWCEKKLERHKVPHHFSILDTLPKSANGKIDKQLLAKMHR